MLDDIRVIAAVVAQWAGAGCLITAAWMWQPRVGLAVLGGFLLFSGLMWGRE